MVLERLGEIERGARLLEVREIPIGDPTGHEVLVRVLCCGVCHTEIDEIEGRTPPPKLPVVPGHEIIGRVELVGPEVVTHRVGDRVGIGWIFDSCAACRFCRAGRENLCPEFTATGRDVDGGYAEYVIVPDRSAISIPERFTDEEAAPLLCAGAVGFRSLMAAGVTNGERLGFFGFGASAHIVLQMARYLYPDSWLGVVTRSARKQKLASRLGADWVGRPQAIAEMSEHVQFDAVIDTTPLWRPIVDGMLSLAPGGGRFIVNAIRKLDSDREALSEVRYPSHLWMEKQLTSVANVTYSDLERTLRLADEIPIKPLVNIYPLDAANRALAELKEGTRDGAHVLAVSDIAQ